MSFAKDRVGKKWGKFNSEKVCSLSYANIQGKDTLIKKFRNSNVMQEEEAYRPKIFYSSGPLKGQEEVHCHLFTSCFYSYTLCFRFSLIKRLNMTTIDLKWMVIIVIIVRTHNPKVLFLSFFFLYAPPHFFLLFITFFLLFFFIFFWKRRATYSYFVESSFCFPLFFIFDSNCEQHTEQKVPPFFLCIILFYYK